MNQPSKQELISPPGGNNVVFISEAASILAIIEKVATNKDLDIERMKQLLEMHHQIVAREADERFTKAFSEMQTDLPEIPRLGKIKYEKDGKQRNTPYALWEDVNQLIKPVLKDHGFALSFKVENGEGKIKVTGILKHIGGHREETSYVLPYDATGAKNNVQSIGSSTSYGKRYTAAALLNLTSRGEDDDGAAGGAGETITDEQVKQIEDKIVELGIKRDLFLEVAGIKEVSDLPASKFASAMKKFATTEKARKKEKK